MITALQGIAFPFDLSSGKVTTSIDEKHIKESLHNLISTLHNEVIMLPEFGTNLGNRVFSTLNFIPLIKSDIRDAILKFEKRVNLINVNVNQDQNNFGVVYIDIDFSYRENFLQLSVNYPIGDI